MPAYDESRDVLRVNAQVGTADEIVDQFTIELEQSGTGADLVLRWERTEIRIPIVPAGM
jgi:hypothetical protein